MSRQPSIVNFHRYRDPPDQAIDWLAQYHHLTRKDIDPYLYTLPRELAVKHSFRVVSGPDSMVLGEPQILGQMKQAVRQAEQLGEIEAADGLLQRKLAWLATRSSERK